LMTAETPPDWAYKAFLRTIFFMAVSTAGKGGGRLAGKNNARAARSAGAGGAGARLTSRGAAG